MKTKLVFSSFAFALSLTLVAATTTDSADKDLTTADITINVAAKDTLKWTGSLTGGNKLIKTGDGTLVLDHDNSETFSGAIEVQGGVVQMDKEGAFGSGPLSSSAALVDDGMRGFVINAAGTVTNNFTFTGASHPTIAKTSSCLATKANVRFTGTITASASGAEFCFNDTGTTAATNRFAGNINTGSNNMIFYSRGSVIIEETCTLTGSFRPYNTSASMPPAQVHFYGDGSRHSVKGDIVIKQMSLYSEAENSLPSSVGYGVTCAAYGYDNFTIDLHGHNQTIKGLTWNSGNHPGYTDVSSYFKSTGGPATLTLSPGAGATTYFGMKDEITLVINHSNSSSTQVFSQRTSPMTGDVIVSNGVMQLTAEQTFPNVPKVYVCGTGKLAVSSTSAGAFLGATNVTLEAKAQLSIAASSPFSSEHTTLWVSNTSKMTIATGLEVPVAELYVNGVRQPDGTYTKASGLGFLLGDGSLVVRRFQGSTGVWNGGAAGSDAISLADNWSGVEPDLVSGDFTAAISNGTHMAVDTAASFNTLVFDPALAGFTFDGDAMLTLGAGGVTMGDNAVADTWTFAGPLVVKDAGTWSWPANDTLIASGGISGTGSLVFEGGPARLTGTNPFTGGLTVKTGTLAVQGVLGSPGDQGKLVQQSAQQTLTLDNAEIWKPCTLFLDNTAIYCTAGSSNIIHGKIGGCIYPNLPADATIVYDGEIYIDSATWIPGAHVVGTTIITAKPYIRGLATIIRPAAGTNIFASGTASFRFRDWYCTYGTAYQRFDSDRIAAVTLGYVEATAHYAMEVARFDSDTGICDLNGTVQHFNGVSGTKGLLTSPAPAVFEVAPRPQSAYEKANERPYCDVMTNNTFGAQIAGPVTLRFAPLNGVDEGTLTLSAREYESTGDLEVTNGTMIVSANATFKRLSRVKAVDAGVFDLRSADAFGDELTLELGGTAGLNVAAGTRLRARMVVVNGVPTHVRPATYTTEQFQEKLGSAFEGSITGDGFIRITGAGTQLILR